MKCPLCNKKGPHKAVPAPDEYPLGDRKVKLSIVICKRCGLVFQDPPVAAEIMEAYYATQNRWPSQTVAYSEQYALINEYFDLDDAAVLDIGAYDGRLLSKIARKTKAIFGVEPDQTVRPIVTFERFDSLDAVGDRKFDLITMGHVLEHITDNPVKSLQSVREKLTKGGTIFIEVPNLLEPQVQLVPYWTAQHIWYFTVHTLTAVMEKAGFKINVIEHTGYGAIRVLATRSEDVIEWAMPDPAISMEAVLDYDDNLKEEWRRIHFLLWEYRHKDIAIFGAGDHTWWLMHVWPELTFNCYFLLDSNPVKQGEYMYAIPIIAPTQLPDQIEAVVISSYDTQDEMAEAIGRRAVKLYQDVKAYDVWSG